MSGRSSRGRGAVWLGLCGRYVARRPGTVLCISSGPVAVAGNGGLFWAACILAGGVGAFVYYWSTIKPTRIISGAKRAPNGDGHSDAGAASGGVAVD